MTNNILKIDLDLETYELATLQLKERLEFLDRINILSYSKIKKIELIKKNFVSARIYLNSTLKDNKDIIIIQGMLGDDWKRISVNFRDNALNIKSFNRLFDIKRNVDGSYIKADYLDITSKIIKC